MWLSHDDHPSTEILAALERWKPVLANRFDVLSNPAMDWWETARPRNREQFCGPKVIALYRTDRGRFAVDEDGSWQPSIKTTLVIPIEGGLSVAYLGGLLNSELLDLWYSIRGKSPRDVWRNYEPKRMKEIPYRHVDLSVAIDKKRLKEVKAALKKRDAIGVGVIAGQIVADLRGRGGAGLALDEPVAVEAAQALEAIVRALADNRRALLPYRDRFPALTRQVKDPWSTEAVDPTPTAFVDALSKTKRVSVRVDPELTATIETDGALGRPMFEHGLLTLAYRRKTVAQVQGPSPKLMLLAELLADRQRLMPADLLAVELPRDVDGFKAEVEASQADVAELIERGRILVEVAERLVCALYGVSAELEGEVVAHAVARAKAAAADSA